MDEYNKQVNKITLQNQPIIEGFRGWLAESGLAKKTIQAHIENMGFFADYLTYYEPLYALDESDADDVHDFLMNWYPRKAMWASEAHTRSYMASFRKFYAFMVQTDRAHKQIEHKVRNLLKRHRDDYLEAVAFDDDMTDW
jgi:site-specific recombinase XerD